MFTTANNPYLLNLVPTFDVANPSGGGTDTTVDESLAALQTIVNTSNHTISVDTIQPYTAGGGITMEGVVDIVGELTVNGYNLGPTVSGCNVLIGTSYIISTGTTVLSLVSTSTAAGDAPAISFITAGSTAFQIDSLGRALYQGDGVTSNVNRCWISSSILSADRAAVGFGSRSTMSTLFDVYKGDAYFDRNLNVNSNISCRTLVQFSDERLKRDIEPISGALSTLCMLKGVHYTMDGRKQLGFIAQDVQRILPDAVYEIEGTLAVDYTRVIPLLVEAVKELARK
jgi:hypothetical protein